MNVMQALIASSLAAGDRIRAKMVVSKVVWMAGAMGLSLASILFVFRHAIAKVFTTDPLVLLFISGGCEWCEWCDGGHGIYH